MVADRYDDKWAVITGASSGLGAEFARQLATLGANLVVCARSEGKLRQLADELSAAHRVEVCRVPVDLARPGGPPELCAAVDRLGVEVEHLVNNAGFGSFGNLVSTDVRSQVEMVRLNCEAVVALSHHFLPAMLSRGSGGIIQLASVAAFQPMPYMATYSASKAFVLSFSTALAEEVRGSGVVVTAVCPGPVPTGFQDRARVRLRRMDRAIAVSAEEAVRESLAAYARGVDIFVPGAAARLGAAGLRLIPRVAAARAARHFFRGRI
jgi:short-subunit dehydrogenase